jgi:hypothetical protein
VATFRIYNLTSYPFSLSAKLSERVQIQLAGITPGSYKTVENISQSDLEANPDVRDAILAGVIRVDQVESSSSDAPSLMSSPLDANSMGQLGVLRYTMAAGGAAGTADDATVLTALPFGIQILDVTFAPAVVAAGSTVTLRSLAGGLGTALSSALASAATTLARTTLSTAPAAAAASGLFARRTDRSVTGVLTILYVRP